LLNQANNFIKLSTVSTVPRGLPLDLHSPGHYERLYCRLDPVTKSILCHRSQSQDFRCRESQVSTLQLETSRVSSAVPHRISTALGRDRCQSNVLSQTRGDVKTKCHRCHVIVISYLHTRVGPGLIYSHAQRRGVDFSILSCQMSTCHVTV